MGLGVGIGDDHVGTGEPLQLVKIQRIQILSYGIYVLKRTQILAERVVDTEQIRAERVRHFRHEIFGEIRAREVFWSQWTIWN